MMVSHDFEDAVRFYKARIHQGKAEPKPTARIGHLRGPMYGSREQLIGRAAQVARYGHEGTVLTNEEVATVIRFFGFRNPNSDYHRACPP